MDASTAPRGGAKMRSACDLCRLRKIRCDRAQPACETCHLAGLPCTFAPPTQQRKGLRQELADTQARVQELESMLTACQPLLDRRYDTPSSYTSQDASSSPGQLTQTASSNYVPDTHSLDAALASFHWHISYCGLGNALSSTRHAFYSAVREQTGYNFDLEDFFVQVTQSFEAQSLKATRKAVATKWPCASLVQTCIDYYAKAGLYSMFPFADVEALNMLMRADVLNNPETSRASHRACLVGLTANITQMHRHDPAFCDADPNAYTQAGLTLIPEILMEPPGLRTLEAVIMLAVYIAPLGQPQSAEFLLGIAVQVLYNLGGNRARPVHEAHGRSQSNQHLRALFWICYGMDREFSIRKGQPPLINDDDCDLDLPAAYAEKSSDHHFYWKPLSSKELLYPSDLRIVLIKSKIYRLLYSPQSQEHSEARRLQHIRELDDELSALRLEYPVACRPDAFATESAPDYLFHDLSIRGVSVHLEYYYCLGKIHGAKDSFSSVPTANKWPPLASSAEICYEAARSTLIYIGHVRHYINSHTFWLHAQFILTAVVTLFRFLIAFPTSPSFVHDLHILETTAAMFTQFAQPDSGGNCFPPFYITEAFVRKLVLLATQSHTRSIER
ncbi:transcriptional regulator family: Fungal Specific TF [Penicillium hispanicum]|uniref:transcriptional regulator family: Fungal Specific TF n=1 Tax=Penicillium hispanicum TaxID=1080232 RepID=UPI002540B1B9|nr:transcriptional regulator family: Fungal Specific TF [Penicillium hispanicum]KAJ5584624.1 transcriptional regulator family: Fungal Specific TF [Penicillium hispanicum]